MVTIGHLLNIAKLTEIYLAKENADQKRRMKSIVNFGLIKQDIILEIK